MSALVSEEPGFSPVVALRLSESIYPQVIGLMYEILEFSRVFGLANNRNWH